MEHNKLIFSKVPTLRFKQFQDNWSAKRLSDIAEVVGGGTPDTTDSTLWNGDIQWFTPTEVGHSKYVSTSIRTISQLGLQKSSAKILPAGSILLSSRATVGECSIAQKDCTTNQGFQSLIPKKSVNNEFLYYLAQTQKRHFIKYASGSTFLEISNSEIKKTKCAVPSIEEQTEIATFLSAIDRKIEVQNKIISKYETLIKGLSCDYFSKQPNHIAKLKDLIIKGKAGGTPSSTVAEYYNGDIPFLSISDMTKQGKYVEFTEKHISENGLANSSTWIVPSNSLILSMYASVGLVCINKVPLATSQAMFSMVLKDCNMLDYIYYYLNFFRETQIYRLLETGTQSNINADTVRDIEIPFYSNILVFVKTLQAIENRLNNEKDMLSRLMNLKTYLLSSLFI